MSNARVIIEKTTDLISTEIKVTQGWAKSMLIMASATLALAATVREVGTEIVAAIDEHKQATVSSNNEITEALGGVYGRIFNK